MTALDGKLYCAMDENKLYERDPVHHDVIWKHIGHADNIVGMGAL